MFKLFKSNYKDILHTTIKNVLKLSSDNVILKYKGLMLPTSISRLHMQDHKIISYRNDKLLSLGEMKSLFSNEKRNGRHL